MDKKKEVVDEGSDILRNLILSKFDSIQAKKFEPKTIDEFSLAFRVFLLRYLNLNYEFTLEELVKDLNKINISANLRDRIIALSTLLVEIEYEGKEISKDEFKSLISEAANIVYLATGKAIIEGEKEKKNVKVQVEKGVLFNFLHNVGLVKTEQEKKKLEKEKESKRKALELEMKNREKERKKKELEEKKREEEERKKKELEEKRQRELEKKKIEEGLRKEEEMQKEIERIRVEQERNSLFKECKQLIDRGHRALNSDNLLDSHKIYTELMDKYMMLSSEIKMEIFKEINFFYKSLLLKRDHLKKKELEKKREEKERKKKELEEKMQMELEKKRVEAESKGEEGRRKLSSLKGKGPIILPPPLPFPSIKIGVLEEFEKHKTGVKAPKDEISKQKKEKGKSSELDYRYKKEMDKVNLIKKDINKAGAALKKSNLHDAKRLYIKIMKIYVSMSHKEQAEVYKSLKELYYKRKRKEKANRTKGIRKIK